MLTNKLCNPTHKDVKFPWDKGVNIRVASDSQTDLTLEQMDDFRPGKPGSEEVREQMEVFGLFLLDGDRNYDEQALSALKNCFKAREGQLRAFVERLRDSRIATGSPVTEEALNEAKRRGGYDVVEEDLDKIQKRIRLLEGVVSKGTERIKEELDPKKTCFATKPPREFPSETALEMFLLTLPEEQVNQHKELQAAMLGD